VGYPTLTVSESLFEAASKDSSKALRRKHPMAKNIV
jgi:hypothetical protein